jgi:AcrR family transcriptional regulator
MARPRQVSDSDILTTARACFLEHGPQTSMQVIADQLGVSQAALFKRFHTKQDLLLAALVPPAPPFLSTLEAGPDDRPIRDQLVDLSTAMSAFFDQTFPCYAALKASGIDDHVVMHPPDGSDPMPLRTHRALVGWLRGAARRGAIRPVDASSIATLIMGALHSHAFLGHFLGADVGPSSDHVREMVDVVWTGIRPEDS